MTSSPAKRNVVDVRGCAFFEKRQQLMLGSVKTTHAGVRFRPYDQIERGQPQSRCGGVSDGQAAPIDERAKDSSVYEMWKDGIHPLPVKLEELCIGHFSGSHQEFPMITPGHVPSDCNIEGLICENHTRDIRPHESFDDGGIASVSADQAMGAEQEQIADPSNWRSARQRYEIASFGSFLVSADYDLIDLVRTKPGNLDRRVGDDEFLEFSF
jgi:hypothetical protein